MDFILGFTIFILAIVIVFQYVSSEDYEDISDVSTNSLVISEILMSSGSPDDWNPATVNKIGIVNDHAINYTKLLRFRDLAESEYDMTRLLFGSRYDYYVYFEDKDGNNINVMGLCGIGASSGTYYFEPDSIAYYFNGEQFFRNEIEPAGIHVYDRNINMSDFFENILNYSVVIMESPKLDDIAPLTSAYVVSSLENYSRNGGILILGGEVNLNFSDAEFTNSVDTLEVSTTEMSDWFFNYTVGDDIKFNNNHYANSSNATDFSVLSRYVDGSCAVCRWKFGNGLIYYMSDFDDTANGDPDIPGYLVHAAVSASGRYCNLTQINGSDIGISSRYVVNRNGYETPKSEIIRMVVMSWV